MNSNKAEIETSKQDYTFTEKCKLWFVFVLSINIQIIIAILFALNMYASDKYALVVKEAYLLKTLYRIIGYIIVSMMITLYALFRLRKEKKSNDLDKQ